MSPATCRLFLSIISMCELPRMPTFGRSTISTLPPDFVILVASPSTGGFDQGKDPIFLIVKESDTGFPDLGMVASTERA